MSFEKQTITVYEKPTCSKCRAVVKALTDGGVDFSAVNYYVEPLSEEKLRNLVDKMGRAARELFRESEPIYKELKLNEREVSDEEAVRLMVQYPDLMQRPIVERGDRAILARPPERLKEIF